MAVNFPDSPTNGQEFTTNGTTFVYNSTDGRWDATQTPVFDQYLEVSNSTVFVTKADAVASNNALKVLIDDRLQVANALSLTSFNLNSNAPSGNGSLSYSSSNGLFTFTPANLTENSPSVVYALSGTDIDPTNGGIQTKTLAADTTFTESLTNGDSVVLMLNAGASYTVTWPTITWVTSNGNAAPTLTANDTIVFWKVGSTLYGAYVGSYT
jgi:hypothetical protein